MDTRPTNFLNDGGKSTQEAYYDYMLRTTKLNAIVTAGGAAGAGKWLEDEEVKALSEVGEREKLEIKILARLSGLSDSSAELLQVKALTDCKSREECAKALADIYYRKYTTEEVINRYVAPATSKKILTSAQASSRANYDVWGAKQ
jgi:hypothetical protein